MQPTSLKLLATELSQFSIQILSFVESINMPSLSFQIINFTCDVGSVDMEPWLRFSSLTHVLIKQILRARNFL